MEKKMEYPYISKEMNNLLFYAKDTAMLIGDEINSFSHGFKITADESKLENNTHEYLQNTYGEVVSPEHAEFIVDLAKANGLPVYIDSPSISRKLFTFNPSAKLFFYDSEDWIDKNRCKQITIPLPPKADKQELSEWPQVGDEVVAVHECNNLKGKLLALTKKYAIISQGGEEQHLHLNAWTLKKPKTPEEELRDDIQSIIFRRHAELVTSTDNRNTLVDMSKHATEILLDEFEIKRKPR